MTKVVGNATPSPRAADGVASSVPVSPKQEVASLQKVGLPKDCDYLTLDGRTTAVVLCRPPEDSFWDKLVKDAPTLFLSFFAIVISIVAFKVSSRQQRNGFFRSVKDDYWLRTLVSPVCITPLLEMRKSVIASLPAVGVQSRALQQFSSEISHKFLEMSDSLSNLGIVDPSLVNDTRIALSLAEDSVSDYIAALGQHINNPNLIPAPDFSKSCEDISKKFFDVLKPIQIHQIKDV